MDADPSSFYRISALNGGTFAIGPCCPANELNSLLLAALIYIIRCYFVLVRKHIVYIVETIKRGLSSRGL